MKKKAYFLIIIAIIFSFVVINKTYSYYIDKADGEVNFAIANWTILLNNTDITEEETYEYIIDNITISNKKTASGENLTNNKFAPGTEASFVIALDCADTLVEFDYDIAIDLSSFNNDYIVVSRVSIDEKELPFIDGLYKNRVTLEELKSNKVQYITIVIEWIDEESNSEVDSQMGAVPNTHVNIPVTISFNQIQE